MLKPGDPAPEFSLPDQTGEVRSLKDLLAPGALILYFYPADFTPVCTEQACFFRDAATELHSLGAKVVGVSPDPPGKHREFAAQHRLGFTLLSDAGRVAIRAYRAAGLFGILPWGLRRVTYLVGPDARIVDAVAQESRLTRHRQFVRRAIDRLRASRGV
jgi:thioredoxin-dependent peroxiredoxin